MNHTPTPWKVTWGNGFSNAGKALIHAEGHGYIAEISNSKRFIQGEEKESNAAFIVTACNAHKDLVKALHDMVVYEGMDYNDDRRIKAVERAKEALAKAEHTL